jgi:valyl-tRNA synthetase
MRRDEALPKTYDPASREPRWYAWWRERDLFRPEVNPDGAPYSIVIPPPNVTGSLHIGHALNAVVQDQYVRRARMQGRRALWVYGIDHAGIATQNVVERELARRGLRKEDLGRDAFVEEVWRWKETHGGRIAEQLGGLGASCDWSRPRFTMDPGLSRAVRKVFVELHRKGLIYRGTYIINWCPRCRTALSDEEVEHEETEGKLWRIAYPLEPDAADGTGRDERAAGAGAQTELIVATTRPETMLGDTGVAVNPSDERHRHLIGRTARLPLLGRALPIVADDFVDPEFGTGVVKVTPAHDPNDYWIGKRHGLAEVRIFDDEARTNELAGPYAGLDRYEARTRVVADLEAQGLLRGVEDHRLSLGRCYRCGTVVEPLLSKQWFVKMKPLAGPALDAVRNGDVRLHPDRWVKVWEHWLENIHDWCISRQLWWGHRIPVWTCAACGHENVSETDPAACETCGSTELRQDEDVLDTWFSSQLWPFSVFGWPDDTEDLRTYYPTNLLVSGPDILFFWIARMVMIAVEFTGRAPFRDVILTGIVRDAQGRKMSKSAGNTVDPMDLIEAYGADALRFTLMFIAAPGTDLALGPERVEVGRNFANKLWNAARFVLGNLGDDYVVGSLEDLDEDRLDLADRWILSRLARTTRAVDAALDEFRPNDVANLLFDFLKHDYCDWYVEWSKARLGGAGAPGAAVDAGTSLQVRRLLVEVLAEGLKLLHPLMPFLTEEIWQRLPLERRGVDSLMTAVWGIPKVPESEDAVASWTAVQGLVTAVRDLRNSIRLPPAEKPRVIVAAADGADRERVERHRDEIVRLARLGTLEIRPEPPARDGFATAVLTGMEVFLDRGSPASRQDERRKLERERERLDRLLRDATRRLENEEFRERAPAEVVRREEEKQSEFRTLLEKLERTLDTIR